MPRCLLLILGALAVACADGTAPPPRPNPAAAPETTAAPSPMTSNDAPDSPPHAHTNRLAQESSPYLLQHQHNPVDWYPWCDEAFEKARREDKPVFLSIGYSTCHWCHVMERESFENEDVAAILNAGFVCIKVDREERPDVDAVYMKAVQQLVGRGGWPLSVWLTADRRPFFGGTYFPPEDRFGRPGFKTILARITDLWTSKRADLLAQAAQLTEAVRAENAALGGGELGPQTLRSAVDQYEATFDAEMGGFGRAPKFPRAFSISLLLRQAERGDRERILPMVTRTLDAMRLGGLHDHLGGGFHRYSTDREWLVPHFEKMLYDQAILARAYVEGWQVTGDPAYAETARDTFEYVLRDLQDAGGAFHSAEDADSEGVEGKFYVWTRDEVLALLGEEEGTLFADVYQVTEDGNFLEEATRTKTGENILHLARPLAEEAAERALAEDDLARRLSAARTTLLAARGKRIRPHLDDKVLTDWNGLMIGALALGGSALEEERYLAAARGAADFLLTNMRDEGGLLHRHRAGRSGIRGFLDDSAFLAFGLLELHQATQEPRWLEAARDLCRDIGAKFHDAERGGFVLASQDGEVLVSPTKELYDGAIPSGNSVAAYALLRAGRLTADADLERLGRETLEAWSGTIERYPMGFPFALHALDLEVGPGREIVVSGDPADEATAAMLAAVRARFLPRTIVVLHPPGDAGAAVRRLSPFVTGQLPVGGEPAAYVCTNYACQAPVTSVEALLQLLE